MENERGSRVEQGKTLRMKRAGRDKYISRSIWTSCAGRNLGLETKTFDWERRPASNNRHHSTRKGKSRCGKKSLQKRQETKKNTIEANDQGWKKKNKKKTKPLWEKILHTSSQGGEWNFTIRTKDVEWREGRGEGEEDKNELHWENTLRKDQRNIGKEGKKETESECQTKILDMGNLRRTRMPSRTGRKQLGSGEGARLEAMRNNDNELQKARGGGRRSGPCAAKKKKSLYLP